MTVLVLSADEEAARSLCSALTRSGHRASWQADLGMAHEQVRAEPPLVFVADTAVVGHAELCASVRQGSPWARIYLIAERGAATVPSGPQLLLKPFDAAEVAALLVSDHELAELERRRQGLEVRADELARLVEASFEAIVGLAVDGTIRTWNRGAATIYGYAIEEVEGRNIDLLEAEPAAAAGHPPDQRSFEVKRRRKDGSMVLVLVSRAPITGPDGEPAGFSEVSLDITERRKLERELEHGQRLAGIGRIAASMAHEINNPLAVIRASASRIAQIAAELGHPELAECAADTDFAAERIGGFVQHVCGFARRERPVLSDLPIRGTIEMAMRLVRPRAVERAVNVVLEPGPDPRIVHDPPRLGQALVNVVANAIDAAGAGGCNVTLRVVPEATRVRIEVDDDGGGIAPEIEGRLFEAFATTKPPGQGTGLGLSTTRQILEDHGGAAMLEARLGGGTRAILTMPVHDLQRYLVLVIEADATVRRALATDVGRAGFRVRSAGTLRDAREMLASEDVRVVLTDFTLPDGSAGALLEELRERSPAVGRILVTTDTAEFAAAPADARLGKPWNYDQLIATLRQLCLAAPVS